MDENEIILLKKELHQAEFELLKRKSKERHLLEIIETAVHALNNREKQVLLLERELNEREQHFFIQEKMQSDMIETLMDDMLELERQESFLQNECQTYQAKHKKALSKLEVARAKIECLRSETKKLQDDKDKIIITLEDALAQARKEKDVILEHLNDEFKMEILQKGTKQSLTIQDLRNELEQQARDKQQLQRVICSLKEECQTLREKQKGAEEWQKNALFQLDKAPVKVDCACGAMEQLQQAKDKMISTLKAELAQARKEKDSTVEQLQERDAAICKIMEELRKLARESLQKKTKQNLTIQGLRNKLKQLSLGNLRLQSVIRSLKGERQTFEEGVGTYADEQEAQVHLIEEQSSMEVKQLQPVQRTSVQQMAEVEEKHSLPQELKGIKFMKLKAALQKIQGGAQRTNRQPLKSQNVQRCPEPPNLEEDNMKRKKKGVKGHSLHCILM